MTPSMDSLLSEHPEPTASDVSSEAVSVRRVCLFGGSFDPVHGGHVAMARAAMEHCGLDRVVFLPAGLSPFKQDAPPLFSPHQRLELLRLALKGEKKMEISDLDLRMPPPSWTWRLVERWQGLHPTDELYWLMGTDQWDQLHRWARFPLLVSQLRFIVYLRGRALPTSRPGVRVSFISAHHPASSSVIRRCLAEARAIPAGWMSPAVEAKAQSFLAQRDTSSTVDSMG